MAIIAGVTVDVVQQDTNEVDSLQIAAHSTLHMDAGLFIVDDGAMASLNNGEMDVDDQFMPSGTFINNGMLAIASDGNLLTNDHTVTLGGTGTVLMIEGRIGGRTFSDATPDDTLINVGDLIEGSGVIGLSGHNNAITFINQSTVDANEPIFPLTLQGGEVNEEHDGGQQWCRTLQLGGSINNGSDAAGTGTGLIEALDGSTVQIGDPTTTNGTTTVTGGRLTQTGTGKIEITGKTIFDGSNKNGGSPGVTLTGAVVVDKGTALTLSGKISGGSIDATQGQVLLSGASLSGTQLKGNIGFGGSGNTLYAADYPALYMVDIAGMHLTGAGLTLADALGNGGFLNSGTFTIGKGGALNINQLIGIVARGQSRWRPDPEDRSECPDRGHSGRRELCPLP